MKVFFTPVIEALQRIGRDPMGKAALGGLKGIVFQNTARLYSPSVAMKFDGGVLTVDHDYGNVDQVKARTDHLVGLLESSL
jgi:hypothetical protein